MAKKKFNLEVALYTAIYSQVNSEGATFLGAFRDVLTDLMHIARQQKIEFKSRLQAAEQVYTEEMATCEDCSCEVKDQSGLCMSCRRKRNGCCTDCGKKIKQKGDGQQFTLCTKCRDNYPD
jgi:hypothetical protein